MLDLDARQGLYGEHLTQLIVTAAGFVPHKPPDLGDGIDVVVSWTQRDQQTVRPPNVELQVKTTRTPRIVGKEVRYDLEVAHYEALRLPGPTQRYLVVVLVPPDPGDWAGHGHDNHWFARNVLWTDLSGCPPTHNTSTVAVSVPLANIYTPGTVESHMQAAKSGFAARFTPVPEAS